MARERDYKREYAQYHGKPEKIKERAQRNAARADMVSAGKASKGDGKDVDHKTSIKAGGGNGKGNLRVVAPATNRAWRKGQKGQI